jgi:dipeptidyl aminopeptidase/acylaminoacyl peptidase
MKKSIYFFLFAFSSANILAQNLTPEALLQLGKLNVIGISTDNKSIIYGVKNYSFQTQKNISKNYSISLNDLAVKELSETAGLLPNDRISPNGNYKIYSSEIKVNKISGKDYYPDATGSDVMIIDDLNYRHWDTWEDGSFSHIFLSPITAARGAVDIDINLNEPYDCPQKPFGGDEDFIWSPDSKRIIYVSKKLVGKAYAISTNTDIYAYDIATKTTSNLTEGMMGYDMNPSFYKDGRMAFLSMRRDGFEADKNDIIVINGSSKINLTKEWDGTVESYKWSLDGTKIYFNAPMDGTIQLFSVNVPENEKTKPEIKQLTKGDFDVAGIVGQVGNTMYVTRTDINHASELYSVDLSNGKMMQLTHINDEYYKSIKLSKVEKRYVTTSDNKKMLVWVVYPPDFDATKKYPTLLYCQGGPQSALTQFYSFRWNFQLMASNGYIVVAPNRRGMPGHGVSWNEEISKDYGGQVMRDYLAAIDDVSKEPFVDKARLGCVGASFGGYSVFYLAGNHNKRFKTFIAHDGIFDWRTMYGTTEEMWFVNWDLGGNYWDKNKVSQPSYNEYNPVNYVQNWDSPILIIQGGKDYRVPIEQGLCGFQAAQLKGLKSKLLFFPEENHWVLNPQNAIIWQREFYKWLKETL